MELFAVVQIVTLNNSDKTLNVYMTYKTFRPFLFNSQAA